VRIPDYPQKAWPVGTDLLLGVDTSDHSGSPEGTTKAMPVSGLADYYANQQPYSGETCIPRLNVGSALAMVSGRVNLTFWTAAKTEQVTTIVTNSGATAAGATPTYCAMGVYLMTGDGTPAGSSLALQGACANDTSLWAATFTEYDRSLVVPFTKVRGLRYAFATMIVSSQALPQLFGYNGTIAFGAKPPVISGQISGQSVLPSTIAAGAWGTTSQMHLGLITP
jgi:hypothetical protein